MFKVKNVGDQEVTVLVRKPRREVLTIPPQREVRAESFSLDQDTEIVAREGDRIDVKVS